MKRDIKNKIILITGASMGIGRETAIEAAKAGACVVAVSRKKDKLAALLEQLPNPEKHFIYPADVTKQPLMQMLFQQIQQRYGRLDILIHNAAIGYNAPFELIDHQKLETLFQINFFSVLSNTQLAIPMLKKSKGQIIFISSVIGRASVPNYAAYCSSKFALEALAEALRPELQVHGITTTVVCPGLTETPFSDNSFREGPPQVKWRKKQSPKYVARKIVKACLKPKRDVVLSFGGHLLIFMHRWFPGLLDKSFKRMLCQ